MRFNYKLNALFRIREMNNNLLKCGNVLNELKDKSIDNKIHCVIASDVIM